MLEDSFICTEVSASEEVDICSCFIDINGLGGFAFAALWRRESGDLEEEKAADKHGIFISLVDEFQGITHVFPPMAKNRNIQSESFMVSTPTAR
jgi:hypothetical protein